MAQIKKEVQVFVSGSVTIRGKKYYWIVIESGKKCVKKHYIFTVINQHVGSEEVEVRAVLNAQATRMAVELFGINFRLIYNSGGTSTRDHYHVQLMQAGKGEALPRAVANIPEIIKKVQQEHGFSGDTVQALLDGIMQKIK